MIFLLPSYKQNVCLLNVTIINDTQLSISIGNRCITLTPQTDLQASYNGNDITMHKGLAEFMQSWLEPSDFWLQLTHFLFQLRPACSECCLLLCNLFHCTQFSSFWFLHQSITVIPQHLQQQQALIVLQYGIDTAAKWSKAKMMILLNANKWTSCKHPGHWAWFLKIKIFTFTTADVRYVENRFFRRLSYFIENLYGEAEQHGDRGHVTWNAYFKNSREPTAVIFNNNLREKSSTAWYPFLNNII